MLDQEYQQRFSSELIRTIMTVSLIEQPGQPRACFIRSGEIIDSMLLMIAVLSATSVETATPAKTRALCDELARKLQRRINSAKLQPSPFETIPGAPS